VVQVVPTPRPDRLVLYLFPRPSFIGDLGWSGLRAALRRGRSRRSCRVPRMQVPHPSGPPSCPALAFLSTCAAASTSSGTAQWRAAVPAKSRFAPAAAHGHARDHARRWWHATSSPEETGFM
jgi:hypothetical protein